MPSSLRTHLTHPPPLLTLSLTLRLVLILYSRHHDAHSPLKYTDIDYHVFTSAASLVARGHSPYDRATYRYTPLLAWGLVETSWGGWWWEAGKVVFSLADVGTGAVVLRVLEGRAGMGSGRAAAWTAVVWLLNPMVANISTRGSSEGVVAVVVVGVLGAVLTGWVGFAGGLLGLGVHLKIYPGVYGAAVWWWLRGREGGGVRGVFTRERVVFAGAAAAVFMGLNAWMFYIYGMPFFENTFAYHLTRIDHRHNFSVYNTLLHTNSAYGSGDRLQVESLAFIPQLFLSAGIIPYMLAHKDLPSTMLAQTLAFVTFNKVCTSQYFLWYMVFLPFYLPTSSLVRKPRLGVTALILWVAGQAAWLHQGYGLEFLGNSTFLPGLWLASMLFFGVNCWILGIVVSDIAWQSGPEKDVERSMESKKAR